ncbi:PspA/IM30 family protein [uncultured Corynebacterium sp.]|uniref:PspA/IM30 family protein n=1 Tax=uncultured Corynebacterium sp. TaxID=159447 RepID=UPI0025E30CDD|nr:PspA/IM30 family protein [uncultured Corynebacterium sp.]
MANPIGKGWKYLMASFDQKIDENADPKVQIQQAVEGAKKQHADITKHATEIIGNKSRLEMQMNRLVESVKQYQSQTQNALQAADAATASGDTQKASEYNQAAEVIAAQLVAAEQELEGLKTQYQAASQAAEQAKVQQQQSEERLREQLAQVDQLLAQADQAKMQEETAATLDSMNALRPDDGTPTLDSVRAKIEKRYTDALGAQELLQGTGAAHIQELSASATDMRASSRLDEIRAEMNKQKALETSKSADAADVPQADEVTEATDKAAADGAEDAAKSE